MIQKVVAFCAIGLIVCGTAVVAGPESALSVDSSLLSISAVEFFDEGTLDTPSLPTLDVVQGSCDPNDPNNREPFYDTFVKLTVENGGLSDVTFNTFSYALSGALMPGQRFRSRRLSPISGAEVAGNDRTSGVVAYFLKAVSGTKRFTGSTESISSTLDFKNVTFRLRGTSSGGERVSVAVRTAVHFGDPDRCE